MIHDFVRLAVSLCACLAVACNDSGAPASLLLPPPGSPPAGSDPTYQGWLLFARDLDGRAELFEMRVDGTGERQITYNSVWDGDAQWSPDRREIVFASTRDSTPGHPGPRAEVYLMNADGSNIRKLTNGVWGSRLPRWSPDGSRIAFIRFASVGGRLEQRVMVMDRDGSNARRVSTSGRVLEWSPDWSPDGDEILFTNVPEGGYGTVYVAAAAGGEPKQLVSTPCPWTSVADARWSPEGSKILASCQSGAAALFVMNVDGSDVRRLEPVRLREGMFWYYVMPTWSPNGHAIAFVSAWREGSDIFLSDAAGGTATPVTTKAAYHYLYDWRRP